MTSITDKINISAGAIRAAKRLNRETSRKLFPDAKFVESPFDLVAADKVWNALSRTHADKICGAFYNEATERQVTRVLNKAIKDFKE